MTDCLVHEFQGDGNTNLDFVVSAHVSLPYSAYSVPLVV